MEEKDETEQSPVVTPVEVYVPRVHRLSDWARPFSEFDHIAHEMVDSYYWERYVSKYRCNECRFRSQTTVLRSTPRGGPPGHSRNTELSRDRNWIHYQNYCPVCDRIVAENFGYMLPGLMFLRCDRAGQPHPLSARQLLLENS